MFVSVSVPSNRCQVVVTPDHPARFGRGGMRGNCGGGGGSELCDSYLVFVTGWGALKTEVPPGSRCKR